MAYKSGSGNYRRVNYYSNPDVIHPLTGTPTGVAGISNNAAIITQNRRAFASIGDESSECNAGLSTITESFTTNEESGTPCMKGHYPYWKRVASFKNVPTWMDCRDICNEHIECQYFFYMVFKNFILLCAVLSVWLF